MCSPARPICATAKPLANKCEIPDGLYPGEYLKPVGEALAARFGRSLVDKPESEWLPIVREAAIEAMMMMIREDLAALDIRHDVFFSERSLAGEPDRDSRDYRAA